MKSMHIAIFLVYAMNSYCADCVDMVSKAMSSWCQENIAQDFGKTHFILGFPHQEYDVFKETKKSAKTKSKTTHEINYVLGEKDILFSPDDDLAQELIALINQESKSILVAIFTFTHDDIAQALIAAHKRGVKVEIITDAGYKSDRYSKIHTMRQQGLFIFEYDPDYICDRRSNIMHHKFVVFGLSTANDAVVWVGSFNFTKAADDRNQESAVILRGSQVASRFWQQFDKMKRQRCVGCTSKTHHGRSKINKL
jgi:phosphatidylserine/phosphatidylglycerophosphate/cardiolipin synthase-like enzyme